MQQTTSTANRPHVPTLAEIERRRAELLRLAPRPQPKPRRQPPEPEINPINSAPALGPANTPPPQCPQPVLAEAALHGLAGLAVRIIAPHTEAHPAAILLQFLAAFGNLAGRGPHCMVDATRHGLNLFVVLVGDSSKARKGTSWRQISRLFAEVDLPWLSSRVSTARITATGLVYALRDQQPPTDRRLLALSEEFASVLRMLKRGSGNLSSMLRCAWDNGDLPSLDMRQHRPPPQPIPASLPTSPSASSLTIFPAPRHTTALPTVASGLGWNAANAFPTVGTSPPAISPTSPASSAPQSTGPPPLPKSYFAAMRRRANSGGIAIPPSASSAQVCAAPPPAAARPRFSVLAPSTQPSTPPPSSRCPTSKPPWPFGIIATTVPPSSLACPPAIPSPIASARPSRAAPDGLSKHQVRRLFHGHLESERIDAALEKLRALGAIADHSQHTAGRSSTLWSTSEEKQLMEMEELLEDDEPAEEE